ncbi:MAG: glucosylceramidase [Oscillospiraceae bacterium]|jgi:glucosylceramidase|nr:glucosylceramidase [Oscillospiraceae bacterium]
MKLYLSAQNTEYLHTPLPMGPVPSGADVSETDDTAVYQTLLGFGGAFTEAAAVTFQKMGAKNRKKILGAYFDRETGLGYALGRVAVGSSDFSEEMYDYLDERDTSLDSYNLSREEKAVFPMVRAAIETRGAPLRLLASPWSPPAFMKDNRQRKFGGALLPEYAGLYAQYLIRFIKEARERGLPVEFLSVQNETEARQTWDSCLYTPEQERDFVKNHLGPALEEAGLPDIKVLIHDHNRDILLSRALSILGDPGAAKYIWGTAIHWYVCEDFTASSKLRDAHPEKHLLFTEGCVEGGPAPGKWSNGERYARNIIGDLNNWVEGWIEWNLVLNAQGGPNHVGNYCCAPILCDTEKDEITINPSYHFIGHFARHIKPGAVRTAHKEGNAALRTLSARNPDGSSVLVALNETDEAQPFAVAMRGQSGGLEMPPHSIATVTA